MFLVSRSHSKRWNVPNTFQRCWIWILSLQIFRQIRKRMQDNKRCVIQMRKWQVPLRQTKLQVRAIHRRVPLSYAITLPEAGDYLIQFYILMFCNKERCEEAQDFISLTVNDVINGNTTVLYKENLLKDLQMEKRWIQQQVEFKSSSEKINVNFFSCHFPAFRFFKFVMFLKAGIPRGKTFLV